MKKLFFILIIFNTLYPNQIAKNYFEKAYSIEKENRKEALKLYKLSLESGLDPELRKTALWRMYFILKEEKNFLQAWEILSKLNRKQNLENRFFEDVEYFTKLSKSDFLQLYNAIKKKDNTNVKYYYEKGSSILKQDILDYFLEYNQENLISEFLLIDSSSRSFESKVFLINYYLNNQRYEKAKELLETISKSYIENLNSENKATILYLLGKVYREKQLLDSSFYFFYAMNYSNSDEEYERNLALALYSFYRSGYETIAYELVDYISLEPREMLQRLFIAILRAEKKPTKTNLKEIEKILYQINENTFLTEQARKILNKYKFYE